ncbi:E3 ubiquitin-protein ligase Rnf220 [Lutzomyia longipalpis]|uniref:E3 ubiquitin-protein ligase Rnf220 n=1 Tax=Lutzomyia longipalpis TaxID=7200 RepID=UPI0024841CA2|nr:E3 ubiquitin-protein ligase Rnf220 [Lutzomyia longipalpis]
MSFEVKTLAKMEKSSAEIETGGSSSSGGQEEGRGFRVRKRLSEPLCCPVCSCTVRPTEIDQHFAIEVDRLDKLTQRNRKLMGQHNNHTCIAGTSSSTSNSCASTSNSSSAPVGGNSTRDSTWGAYQKIKRNRQTRLKMKSKRRKLEQVCPICDKSIPSTEDINIHVEGCLRKTRNDRTSGSNSSDDDSIDIDGETFDEYEFAGETRIRATSLIEGGLSGAGIGTVVTKENPDDDDEDLNVDGDDTHIYGPPQYSEKDVISPLIVSQEENGEHLRRLVMGNSSRTPELVEEPEDADTPATVDVTTVEQSTGKPHEIIIETLKKKIYELESGNRNKYKCLICLDEYKVPVVSISCWHVHCEECWLLTLGARKLCPQCNMITSMADLRRIYL